MPQIQRGFAPLQLTTVHGPLTNCRLHEGGKLGYSRRTIILKISLENEVQGWLAHVFGGFGDSWQSWLSRQ
jgi:hypothetical protein